MSPLQKRKKVTAAKPKPTQAPAASKTKQNGKKKADDTGTDESDDEPVLERSFDSIREIAMGRGEEASRRATKPVKYCFDDDDDEDAFSD
jgi:hypothetical protein